MDVAAFIQERPALSNQLKKQPPLGGDCFLVILQFSGRGQSVPSSGLR